MMIMVLISVFKTLFLEIQAASNRFTHLLTCGYYDPKVAISLILHVEWAEIEDVQGFWGHLCIEVSSCRHTHNRDQSFIILLPILRCIHEITDHLSVGHAFHYVLTSNLCKCDHERTRWCPLVECTPLTHESLVS